MKKLDFAIHLFATARMANGTGHRNVSAVVMLVMLELAKRGPDDWHSGPVIGRAVGVSSNFMAISLRKAVTAGVLQSRVSATAGQGGAPLEWRLTPKGKGVIAAMLDTSARTQTPALAQ